jgi:hypothetical protein
VRLRFGAKSAVFDAAIQRAATEADLERLEAQVMACATLEALERELRP